MGSLNPVFMRWALRLREAGAWPSRGTPSPEGRLPIKAVKPSLGRTGILNPVFMRCGLRLLEAGGYVIFEISEN